MKKVIITAISVLTMMSLMLMSLSVSVSAANVSVNVRTVEVSAGDDFRIYIDLDDLTNVVGYEIKIAVSDSSAITRITQPSKGSLSYSNGIITISDSAAAFDYTVGYGEPTVSVETSSETPSSEATSSESTSTEETVTETPSDESGLQIMAPAIQTPAVIDYSSINFSVSVNRNTTVNKLSFTVTSFKVDTYSSTVDATGVTYYSKNEKVPANSGSSTSIKVITNIVPSETSSEVSSEASSEVSSEASSEILSDVSSDLLSDVSSDQDVIANITSDTESTDSTAHTSSTGPTVSTLLNNSNNRKNTLSIMTVVIIIILAFVAGLATMFLIIKLRNADDEEYEEDDENAEYFGGYQQGFVGGAVGADNEDTDSAQDDGYSTVEDDNDVKVNVPKKPKFDIHIEYDDNWEKNTPSSDDGFFEITDEAKNSEGEDKKIDPYYFDED